MFVVFFTCIGELGVGVLQGGGLEAFTKRKDKSFDNDACWWSGFVEVF